MSSGDSGQGESICTPRGAPKRLFGLSGSSSSKRNLFNIKTNSSQDTEMSGEESDLGPMSPLTFTDPSEGSCDSSPGRTFVSPFTTPEKSPCATKLSTWDRLRPHSTSEKNNERLSPFSALKTLTKVSRASPRRKILQNSPKSLPSTPRNKCVRETLIGTPEREIAILFDDIVPETPQKEVANKDDANRVEETPRKDEENEKTLITPLGSVQKEIIIPRLHRRKSLCPFDNEETSSPERKENVLKRHANDSLVSTCSKFQKIDENTAIPKARASLFREKKDETTSKPMTEFKLSTKSFYSSLGKRRHSGELELKNVEPVKKRHSLPSYMSNHTYHRRPPKRQKYREMNGGVRHGIKRPKAKRHVSRIDAFKVENQKSPTITPVVAKTKAKLSNDSSVSNIHEEPGFETPVSYSFGSVQRQPSPVADPNKRFFKTNRTLKSHNIATVTVNNKIKLNVSDGKIALNEKHTHTIKTQQIKKPSSNEISFDASDLTVDEPGFDTSMEKRNVDGILKILEDDWADDDYDTLEPFTKVLQHNALSPAKSMSVSTDNVVMSPASVLSDMTSSMNIKDLATPQITENTTNESSAEVGNNPEEMNSPAGKKLYPLFTKGYSSNIAEDTTPGKKTPRGIKRSWQTSAKAGGAEDQYQIDAGQRKFGASICNECGVVYQLGDAEDENAHLNYHNSVKILKFNGWKNERVIIVDPFTNSRIIAIEPGDPKQCWKKVEEVLAVVDKDLGLADVELSNYLDKKVYFYVRNKTILGVMVAEVVKTAHRMIPELLEFDCCSAEETPAKCGVNVIWTAMSHRRQKIATKLLDTLRTSYYFGYIMSLDDIAFSMPTPSGKIFAEKYMKTRNFKVYS